VRNYLFYLFVFFSIILLSGFLSGKPIFAHEWFYVKWINDGDTIVLADGRHVRYIGINAPEIDHTAVPAKCNVGRTGDMA
jgi:hypothetical protein